MDLTSTDQIIGLEFLFVRKILPAEFCAGLCAGTAHAQLYSTYNDASDHLLISFVANPQSHKPQSTEDLRVTAYVDEEDRLMGLQIASAAATVPT